MNFEKMKKISFTENDISNLGNIGSLFQNAETVVLSKYSLMKPLTKFQGYQMIVRKC